MKKIPQPIVVIGLWHLGEIYSACLAELGHTVIGISDDVKVVSDLKKGVPPLREPGLRELIIKNQKNGRLTYTNDWTEIEKAAVVWFTFDTHVAKNDLTDLSIIWEALERVLPCFRNGVIIGFSSQLPVGTSERLINKITEKRPNLQFSYFYAPENIQLGNAVERFMNPGRIVIGADEARTKAVVFALFAPLKTDIIFMNVVSAEMAKHAINAWFALSISFTNDIADICREVGGDVEAVIKALKTEPRIGPKAYFFAGLGFSGGTLGRDLQSLLTIGKSRKLSVPTISAAYMKNRDRSNIVTAHLVQLFTTIKKRRFSIFGITYKAGTATLRHSRPLLIEKKLREAGAKLRLFDRNAIPKEVAKMTPSRFFRNPYVAAKGAEAVIVLSADPVFGELNFKKLARVMKKRIIFDAQNILISKEEEIKSAGFLYLSIGRP